MKKTISSPVNAATPAQLREAADILEQIETLTTRHNALITGGIVTGSLTPVKAKRRFSPAVRARIAAGQRAKWAERKAAKATGSPVAQVA